MVYVSEGGAKTFHDLFSSVHSADHALWIDADDTNRAVSATRSTHCWSVQHGQSTR